MDLNFLRHLCSLARPAFAAGMRSRKEIQWKAGRELVTSVDLQINEILGNELRSRGFSDSEIVSEESPHTEGMGRKGPCWVIDPVDGTQEFVDGYPEFALSIAYLEDGKLMAGAVFNPAADKVVAGSRADGIWYEGAKLVLPSRHVLCSRSEHRKGLFARFANALPVHPVGSAAYKLALVAAGDAYAMASYQPKKSWDVAAGACLVEIAGGIVRDIDGRPLDFSEPLRRFPRGVIAVRDPEDFAAVYSAYTEGGEIG